MNNILVRMQWCCLSCPKEEEGTKSGQHLVKWMGVLGWQGKGVSQTGRADKLIYEQSSGLDRVVLRRLRQLEARNEEGCELPTGQTG
jgi:hypothetical protein